MAQICTLWYLGGVLMTWTTFRYRRAVDCVLEHLLFGKVKLQ